MEGAISTVLRALVKADGLPVFMLCKVQKRDSDCSYKSRQCFCQYLIYCYISLYFHHPFFKYNFIIFYYYVLYYF